MIVKHQAQSYFWSSSCAYVCVGVCACTCTHCVLWLWNYLLLLQETSHRRLSLISKMWVKSEVFWLSHPVFCKMNQNSANTTFLSWNKQKDAAAAPLARLLTFHSHRHHLLYVFEEEMQLWCNIVQQKVKGAVEEQRSGCSVGMHRPGIQVMNGNVRLQSSPNLLTTEAWSSSYKSKQEVCGWTL